MRRLKSLAALLAIMTVTVAATISPAQANHWHERDWHDERDCEWEEVWEWSWVFERWRFEGWELVCEDDDDEDCWEWSNVFERWRWDCD